MGKFNEPLDPASGLTLLHYASFYGNVKAMRYILSTGQEAVEALLQKDVMQIGENC